MKKFLSPTGFLNGMFWASVLSALPVFTVSLFAEIPAEPSAVSAFCVAHRGFSAVYPENTAVAMKGGIDVGANGNEMDIRISKDGVLYLNHDGNLKRYTGEDIAPSSLTMEELRKRDVGSHRGAQFKGELIPDFDSIIKMHVGTKTVPVVEIKEENIEAQTLEILKKYDMADKCVIIAFSANVCKKMRALDKDIFIAWLCGKGKEESNADYCKRVIAVCSDCGINAVDMEHSGVNSEVVKTLHDAGLTVFCWTVDNAKRMRECIEAGVDSITTNCPDILLNVMAEKK